MNYQDFTFVVLLSFGITLSTVHCLKCHICNTINPGEADCDAIPEGHTKYLQNCSAPNDVSCRIQQQWVEFEVLKQTTGKRTMRQCASIKYEADKACYYRAGFGGKVNVCNCISDGCNGATRFASTVLLITALLLFGRWIS